MGRFGDPVLSHKRVLRPLTLISLVVSKLSYIPHERCIYPRFRYVLLESRGMVRETGLTLFSQKKFFIIIIKRELWNCGPKPESGTYLVESGVN